MSSVEQEEVIAWSDPPPVKRGGRPSRFTNVIKELKANPHQKAQVMSHVNSASAAVFREAGLKVITRRSEVANGLDPDDFDSDEAYQKERSKVDVWAVWEGDPVTDDTPSKPKGARKTAAKKTTAAKKAPASPKKARPKAKK